MSISDESVEAALSALFPDREKVSDFSRAVQEPTIRTILEAAAPHLMAQAWDEGEHAGYQNCGFDDLGLPATRNPYRSAGAGE